MAFAGLSLALTVLGSGASLHASPATVPATALVLSPGDLRIEQLSDGGYHLYVRAKAGMASVLLTESTSDPAGKVDNFAYRALEKNAVNGGEVRLLEGKKIAGSGGQHFLIDSSPEPDASMGRAFHIFIPWVVAWGYPWSRSGKEFIHDGTFINVRTFAKPYADYSGGFADNPFVLHVSQVASRKTPLKTAVAPTPTAAPITTAAKPPTAAPIATAAYDAKRYLPDTIASFKAITAAHQGELRFASSDDDILAQIDTLISREKGKSLDVVFCLDATDTMINGIAALKAGLPALLARRTADFSSLRFGLVAFKDYFEEYLYRRFDFSQDLAAFTEELDSLQAGGGRDIPEAVFEAIFAASTEFDWLAQSKLVVLVGDAPPHPLPRGSVDGPAMDEAAASEGIEIDAVAVPK